MTSITENDVLQALSTVIDPELDRSLTELDMVKSVRIEGADVYVTILLTIAGCPLQGTLVADSIAAIKKIPSVENAYVDTEAMTDEQRKELRLKLRGSEPVIPFAQPDSTTRVLAVASGKGGVGK